LDGDQLKAESSRLKGLGLLELEERFSLQCSSYAPTCRFKFEISGNKFVAPAINWQPAQRAFALSFFALLYLKSSILPLTP
jgi:hypothetical protein